MIFQVEEARILSCENCFLKRILSKRSFPEDPSKRILPRGPFEEDPSKRTL
jgi:hypothetical protein